MHYKTLNQSTETLRVFKFIELVWFSSFRNLKVKKKKTKATIKQGTCTNRLILYMHNIYRYSAISQDGELTFEDLFLLWRAWRPAPYQ